MSHEYEQNQAITPAAVRIHNDSFVPGQSSRNAVLRKPEHAIASGLVQRKTCDRCGKHAVTEQLPHQIATMLTGDLVAIQMKAHAGPDPNYIQRFATEGISGPSMTLPFLEQIQRSFGAHEVSNIHAHIGGPATEVCTGMGARAYATGSHVAFREHPDLHTAAHEAAHVVQQRAGVQLSGGIGQVGDEYERNADQVADAVLAGKSAQALLGGVGQRKEIIETSREMKRSATSQELQKAGSKAGSLVQAVMDDQSDEDISSSSSESGDNEYSESPDLPAADLAPDNTTNNAGESDLTNNDGVPAAGMDCGDAFQLPYAVAFSIKDVTSTNELCIPKSIITIITNTHWNPPFKGNPKPEIFQVTLTSQGTSQMGSKSKRMKVGNGKSLTFNIRPGFYKIIFSVINPTSHLLVCDNGSIS